MAVANVEQLRVIQRGFAHLGTGPLAYQAMWDEQRQIHDDVAQGVVAPTVLLLEHEPVFTAGKRTNAADRPLPGVAESRGASVIDVDRGGSITWHGPGQIVGYPILRLPQSVYVVDFVRRIESLIMKVCNDFSVPTLGVTGRSGVWVPATELLPERKICAIGVRVARGVTMHGFALNVNPDLSWFDMMTPCGISDAGVTSLSKELGRDITISEVLPVLTEHLEAEFGPWLTA